MCYITMVTHWYELSLVPICYITMVTHWYELSLVPMCYITMATHWYELSLVPICCITVVTHRYEPSLVPFYYSDHAWRMRDWREWLSIFAFKLFQGLLVLFSSRKRKVEKCLKCRLSLGVFSLAKQRHLKVLVPFGFKFNTRKLPVIDL